MLSVPIREATIHPSDKIFLCQLTIHTIISFCHSLIFPLFKIILKNGMSLNSGGISLVILVINLYGGVVRRFLFVVFKCHNILTVPNFTLGNSVTVVCVVVALHNEILATVYKGNIIKNLIMDCQSYTKYRPNETTGGIFVSWRRKEELPTGA